MLPEIANLKFSCKFISGVFTYFWQNTFYIPSCWIILELHVKWNRCNFLKFLCFLIYILPIVPIQGHCQQNLTTIDTTVNVSYICTRWQNKPHYFYNLIAILYIYVILSKKLAILNKGQGQGHMIYETGSQYNQGTGILSLFAKYHVIKGDNSIWCFSFPLIEIVAAAQIF